MKPLIRIGLRKANSIRKKIMGEYLLQNRVKLLRHFNIQSILDVGANTGQFGYYTRKMGYEYNIISFEPQTSAFRLLKHFAKSDPKWTVYNYAIGNIDGSIDLNISANSQSSSILQILPRHVESVPDSMYVGKEQVTIKKLDTVIGDLVGDYQTTFLKIDTQGFEKQVLDGAVISLQKIRGLQLELSLVELYKGQTLIFEMIDLIQDYGFTTYSLEPGFYDKTTGQLLQVDGIFYRK